MTFLRDTERKYEGRRPPLAPGAIEKAITERLIFPPLLVWDLIKLTMKIPPLSLLSVLGRWAALPAGHWYKGENNVGAQGNVRVKTYDGAELDTIEVHPARLIPPKNPEKTFHPDQPCIIYFCGNGETIQHLHSHDELEADAKEHDAVVVGFNYRGVNYSGGSANSLSDLITDGITQVQRMLDRGIDAKNITLKAHSLGGLVATAVTRHFHELELEINLYCGRAPTSTSDALTALLLPEKDQSKPDKTRLDSVRQSLQTFAVYAFIKPLVMLFGYLAGWERHVKSDWDTIPPKSKQTMFVRSGVRTPKEKDSESSTASIMKSAGQSAIASKSLEEKVGSEASPDEYTIHGSDRVVRPEASLGKEDFDDSLAALAIGSKAMSPERADKQYRKITDAEMKGPVNHNNTHGTSLTNLTRATTLGDAFPLTGQTLFDRFMRRHQQTPTARPAENKRRQ